MEPNRKESESNRKESEPSQGQSTQGTPAVPKIVEHAASRSHLSAKEAAPPPILGDQNRPLRAPHIQGSPRKGEVMAPTPTMFPITEEIYGTIPQPSVNQEVTPEIICPTPDPVGLATRLDEKIHTPLVSPLPTPSVIASPRLTEADAEVIDIWFFRGQIPEEREQRSGELCELKLLRQVDQDFIPLTPPMPG